MMNKILFIGGTGTVGSVLSEYAAQDFSYTFVTRNIQKRKPKGTPNQKLVQGNFENGNSISEHLEGHDIVLFHFHPKDFIKAKSYYTDSFKRLVESCRKYDINRFIYLGFFLFDFEDSNSDFELSYFHKISEEILIESGISYTIIYPALYNEYLRFFIRGNRANIIGEQNQSFSFISISEINNLINKIIKEKAYANEILQLVGPEKITLDEAIKLYASVVKPGSGISNIPLGMMQSISALSNNPEIQFTTKWLNYLQRRSMHIRDEYKVIKSEIGLMDWCDKLAKGLIPFNK